ncbi:MAG: hypothetical protein KAS36_10115 [Anaerolineales bacterium]|nr:hypothetical protein [Anaerolineales bacterium]
MRKILSDDAMRAARAQTRKKLKTLTEVVLEMSREPQYYRDDDLHDIWKPFEPYLDMPFEDLPLDFETYVRRIVREIVNWTGGNSYSNSEEGAVEVAKEMLYELIQKFKDV